MQNMFTQKTLFWAGLSVAVVIGGIVFIYSNGDQTPPANLETVTERANDMKQSDESAKAAVVATTSAPTVVTPQPQPEPVADVPPAVTVTPEPKPVVVTPPAPTPAPAPVVTTPKPEPVPAPAPAPTGITKAEVATHATESSCWSIISGSVYDLTDYVSRHPGGKSRILGICGKDGTRSFEGQHGGESKPERILSGYFIDNLAS